MKFPQKILMVSPEYFDVIYQINNHMSLENKVDKELAYKQWSALKESYEELGLEVIVAPGDSQFPDMVFAANQLLTTPDVIFLSQMKHPERAGEVEYLKNFLALENALQLEVGFESMGDCIWDYEGERLFGGYGYRTEKEAYEMICQKVSYDVIELELMNSNFYHLDTCLSIINKDTALFVPSAFSNEGKHTLQQSFQKLIEVSEKEALKYLACNAHCPDGKHILVEQGAIELQQQCRDIGLHVISLDTSEFLKSGGSIFCLKNQGWF